ncbi:MAG TPA: PA14 domain-containing protein, partial [Planctomycetota bacterium]|nr:PA14 domain-containing protein [Planctomycetota bacterium]
TVNMPEQPGYRVALYFINQDTPRAQTLELLDSKEAVLHKLELEDYRVGVYVIFDVVGPFRVRLTKKSGTNAVMSAIFFDPIGKDAPPPPVVAPSAAGTPAIAAPSGPDDATLIEYERAVGNSYLQMRAFDSRDAIASLERVKADKRFAPLLPKLDLDIELARGLDEFRKLTVAGAALLADKRAFTLVKNDGEQLAVGGSSKNSVTSVKDGSIEVEKSIGGGKLSLRIDVDQLAPGSRLELATLAAGNDPDALIRLCFATLIALENSSADVTLKQVRSRMEAAGKAAAAGGVQSASHRALLEHIAGRIEAHEREAAAEPAFKAVEALITQKKWEEAETALAKFQKDYLVTKALERLKPHIERRAAEIDAHLHPPKPGLWASYWSLEKGAAKAMVLSKVENTVNFNLNANSPDPAVPPDFGLRMGGMLKIEKDATYNFQAKADDRIICWIDGKEVLNGTTNKEVKANVPLTKGNHDLKIWFADNTGNANLTFNWKVDGEKTYMPVPTSALCHDERKKELYQKE